MVSFFILCGRCISVFLLLLNAVGLPPVKSVKAISNSHWCSNESLYVNHMKSHACLSEAWTFSNGINYTLRRSMNSMIDWRHLSHIHTDALMLFISLTLCRYLDNSAWFRQTHHDIVHANDIRIISACVHIALITVQIQNASTFHPKTHTVEREREKYEK